MPSEIRITFAVPSKMDSEIKKEAKKKGVSISEYCRQKILSTENIEEINPITLENRIEKLAEQQQKLAINILFLSRFLYHFTVGMASEEEAKKAEAAAIKELENIEKGV